MKLQIWDLPAGPESDRATKMLEAAGCKQISHYRAICDTRHYSIALSRDPLAEEDGARSDLRWHVSIAGESDVPRWADLVAIAHHVRPGVPFVVGVPPRSWWINIHPHCLHLWESADRNLLAQWQSEGQEMVPT